MPPASHRVLTSDGVELAVSVEGEGPTLVLIPGLGATRRVYASLIPLLAGRHRTIAYDPRGTGSSDVPAGPYPMSRLARDCLEVAAGVGASGFHLFGASMGGVVAAHVAVLHGDAVGRLILAATGPGRYGAVPPRAGATAALLGRGARSPEEAYRMACTVLYSERYQREQPEAINAEVRWRGAHPLAAQAFAAQFRASRESDISSRLGEITAPTLVLHGTEDVLMPVENARLLVRGIPGAVHHFFSGAGHLFFQEEPASTAAVMLSFLR